MSVDRKQECSVDIPGKIMKEQLKDFALAVSFHKKDVSDTPVLREYVKSLFTKKVRDAQEAANCPDSTLFSVVEYAPLIRIFPRLTTFDFEVISQHHEESEKCAGNKKTNWAQLTWDTVKGDEELPADL